MNNVKGFKKPKSHKNEIVDAAVIATVFKEIPVLTVLTAV